MIYEIRDYTFDAKLFDEYKVWAREQAIPYLREHLDIVGFWVNLDIAPEVEGEPLDALSTANITWIIRWEDKAQRDMVSPTERGPAESWQKIIAQVPGGRQSYRRTVVRFTEAL